MKDFSFQGEVQVGPRLAGAKPGAMVTLGDVPKLDLAIAEEKEKRKESRSGLRMTSAVLKKGREATLAGTLNWANAHNLALGFGGTVEAVAAGTATGELFPDDLVVGDLVSLDHMDISSLVVTDSNGTPATLTEGTHYQVDSAMHGRIRILNLGAFTQPFKGAYSYAASSRLAMMTTSPPEKYLILDGINTITNEPVKVRLYRVLFDFAGNLPLINESFGELPFTAEVLYDFEAAEDASLGGFGRIEQRPDT